MLAIAMGIKEEIKAVVNNGSSGSSSGEQSRGCSGDEETKQSQPWKNEVSKPNAVPQL